MTRGRAPRASISMKADRCVYSDEAARIAAHVFSARAEILRRVNAAAHEFVLAAKDGAGGPAALEALGGEFLNELLNQQYRILVARFNRKSADFIATQALLAARGGEGPDRAEPMPPLLTAELQRLKAIAESEMLRTMPEKSGPRRKSFG